MTGKEDPKPESPISDRSGSDTRVHLVINQYQPIVFIDGALLNPENGMMELMLTKSELSPEFDEGGSAKNIVLGRYIMQMETFARISKLFRDQFEKSKDESHTGSTTEDQARRE